jgi:hypothetical protein
MKGKKMSKHTMATGAGGGKQRPVDTQKTIPPAKKK